MVDDAEIFHDGPDETEDGDDAAGVDQQHEQPLGDDAAVKHIVNEDEQQAQRLHYPQQVAIAQRHHDRQPGEDEGKQRAGRGADDPDEPSGERQVDQHDDDRSDRTEIRKED